MTAQPDVDGIEFSSCCGFTFFIQNLLEKERKKTHKFKCYKTAMMGLARLVFVALAVACVCVCTATAKSSPGAGGASTAWAALMGKIKVRQSRLYRMFCLCLD